MIDALSLAAPDYTWKAHGKRVLAVGCSPF